MIIENDVLVSVSDVDVKNGIVNIPDGVKRIGNNAFYKCSELTSVTIPDSVESIGNWAFCRCNNLTSVTIPDSVTSIGNSAFENCSNLTNVIIGNGVTSICEFTFFGCNKLTSVTIGNGVTSIDLGAFYDCNGLTNISIPDSVTRIGEGAFYDTSLKRKVANYKAFRLKGDKLFCQKKEYREGVKNRVKGVLELCRKGIHYCTNLFDIFNYYHGELDKDIAIYEIEVGDKVLESDINSKCCTNSCVLKKRLYREDIIRILNGGEANND